jgi:anti-sigma factor RsiW
MFEEPPNGEQMTCDEVKTLLNAYFDGELDAAQKAKLESHLAECRLCAADLEKLQGVRTAIREDMVYHEAPGVLGDRIRFALRGAEYLDRSKPHRAKPRPRWPVWSSAAAAVVLLGLISAPFLVNQHNQRTLVAEELLSAHQRALAGRAVDVVSSDQHTVKPWFNGKLVFSPPVADLAAEGFPLEGGRVDYVGGSPVAALMYRRRLHWIDVFVWPAGEQTAPANFERNGFREVSWTKDGFLFTAVSDLSGGELAAFAGLLKGR